MQVLWCWSCLCCSFLNLEHLTGMVVAVAFALPLLLGLCSLLGFTCTSVAPVQINRHLLQGLGMAAAIPVAPSCIHDSVTAPQLVTESWCGVHWKDP